MISLLGTPSPEDIRASGASEGAFRYIMSQTYKPSAMHTLHTLSSWVNHEAVHLICQMLVFNPHKRISVADALTHPYLDEGRLRYHTCMCTCCHTTSAGRQYANGEFNEFCFFMNFWILILIYILQEENYTHDTESV